MKNTQIEALNNCGTFEHFISLGHCCYVAIELEQLGLRDSSMPFDWVRTRWHAIERSFNTNFEGYLNYEDLYQKKSSLHSYKNLKYGVGFFHDFVDNKPLKSQISDVQKKYERRINRFFKNITFPTLFIRYLWDYEELLFISTHYEEIEKNIKQYNSANEIVFISHDSPNNIDTSKIKFIFFIDKDEKDELNQHPLSSCKDFYDYLTTINYPKRQQNLEFNKIKAENKIKKSKTITYKIKKKCSKIFSSKNKKYIHDKQC